MFDLEPLLAPQRDGHPGRFARLLNVVAVRADATGGLDVERNGGSITNNMAIVPAGVAGRLNTFANGITQLILDISGYFAP